MWSPPAQERERERKEAEERRRAEEERRREEQRIYRKHEQAPERCADNVWCVPVK